VKRNLSTLSSALVLSLFVSGMTPETAEAGLWPFASKKHVKKSVDPLTGRVSEMEEVNRQHSARIGEIDERTQAGIRTAMSKAEEADAKAIAAGQNAALAESAAGKAYASVGEVETRLNNRLQNVENYKPVRTLQLNFKVSQTDMDETTRGPLDELATELKDSKGYILEVHGFTDPSGSKEANLEISRQRAANVVRYLAEKHAIPLFRMRTLGMGSANAIQDENGRVSSKQSRRVEVHLLRNDSSQVASN
jgi:OmpA-OmpF porin, OOP family